MTDQEIKQDFDSALIKHLHFKSRLRSCLFGNALDETTLRDAERCSLGQWVAQRLRGAGPYAHLPEARRFDQLHRDIHAAGSRLLDLYKAGHPEQATAGLRDIQVVADEMTKLLQTMAAQLRTAPGSGPPVPAPRNA